LKVRRRLGRCFELAGRGQQMVDPTWTLVHGRIAAVPGLLVAHAWLEKRGVVYDPVLDRLMPARQYARDQSAVIERRYSFWQAVKASHASGHWGPWHPCETITVARSAVLAASTRRQRDLSVKPT